MKQLTQLTSNRSPFITGAELILAHRNRAGMLAFQRFKWILIAAAAIVGYQCLCPPVVGLADQGDFRRVVGKFGYGPEQPATFYAYATLKYVRDPAYRWPEWEQFSSEDLFVGTAVLVNKVISKDGNLDIRVIGLVHALAFLASFACLLHVTQGFRLKYYLWIVFLLITTDVARIAYFNTFYAEPASYVFCIFLLAEGIALCVKGVSTARLARWLLWTVLFVLAKPMNAPLGFLLAAYTIRLAWGLKLVKLAWIGAIAIVLTCIFSMVTAPSPMRDVNAYDLIFLAVLPESKTPAADAATLGIDPSFDGFVRNRIMGNQQCLSRVASAWGHRRQDNRLHNSSVLHDAARTVVASYPASTACCDLGQAAIG